MWRVFLILLIPILARGQFNDLNDPGFVAGLSQAGEDLPPNIGFRWKASSLSSSPVETWTDLIRGYSWTNGSVSKPLWTNVSGGRVEFYGTNMLHATNMLQSGSPITNAYLLVLNFDAVTTPQMVLGKADTGGERFIALGAGSAGFLYENSDPNALAVSSGHVFDIIIARTNNSPSSCHVFTNGVSGFVNANGWNPSIDIIRVGSGNGGAFFKGQIYEYIVWTNVTAWTMTDVNKVHNYAKARYTFSP